MFSSSTAANMLVRRIFPGDARGFAVRQRRGGGGGFGSADEVGEPGRLQGAEISPWHRPKLARRADFLVELHKRVQHLTPAFEHFFYQAIKDHILAPWAPRKPTGCAE